VLPAATPARLTRRTVLGAIGLLGVGVAAGREARQALALSAPRLFAFVPALESTRAIEEILGAGLPGVAVTAFGRFADFSAAVLSEKPEGALSPLETLRVLGVNPALQGEARGSVREPYVVLSKDPSDSIESLARKAIGVVDIVGRSELPPLIMRLLGLTALPTVKRVLKVSDLLPLLTLDLASAVTLPERFLGEFQKSSRLSLRILRPSTALLGRVALGFPAGPADHGIEKALRQAPANVLNLLGVEGFQ
jgi:hypothetical protein